MKKFYKMSENWFSILRMSDVLRTSDIQKLMTNMFRRQNKNSNKNTKESKKTLSCLILLGLAIVFIILTYAVYIPSIKTSPQKFKGQYPFLNPGVALVDKDDLLVNFQPPRDSLTKKYEKRDDYLISLYFEYLPTGANISLNKDEKIWPASLIKIPVAMAAMKKVETGKWKLTNELVILDEDKDSEYGKLYQKPTGTTLTVEEFLKESLVNSDNTAHFVLLRNLESEEIEDIYNHLGLDDIIEAVKRAPKEESLDNRITAKRYSVFFRSLYNSTYLSPEYSQMFMDILKDAPAEYLSAGFPSDVIFAHKTGVRIDEKVWADSGIIYLPNRPYLLTVMIQKKNSEGAEAEKVKELFKDISEEIYDYVSRAR